MKKSGSLYSHPALSSQRLREVAVAAFSDPRVVVKYLRGLSMTSTSLERVEHALRLCGLELLVGFGQRAAADQAHVLRELAHRSASSSASSPPATPSSGTIGTNGATHAALPMLPRAAGLPHPGAGTRGSSR